MDLIIHPHKLSGDLQIIPSKSQAHRFLICAAFADGPTNILCSETNRDMDATADCLRALGAEITKDSLGYHVVPAKKPPKTAVLPCRDSGSTLRFLLPVAGALGVDAVFKMEGRLSQRPLSPLSDEMERMGCRLSFLTENELHCEGRLKAGIYRIDGGISSQFITGLLLALSLIPGTSQIVVSGTLQSKPYVDLTKEAMLTFGIPTEGLTLPSQKAFHSPGTLAVEGDWSNAAFFLTANALGSDIRISGLRNDSSQGDRAVSKLLAEIKNGFPAISAADIPDLIPILAVAAACSHGAFFCDAGRLRLKESDRIQSVLDLIVSLGGKAEATENTLKIYGTGLTGGSVDSKNDHRIAMAAAIAATVCTQNVEILGAQCTEKSYPRFFQEYERFGGNYEQHIRR